MDVLAHGLWTNVMYKVIPVTRNNRKITIWGVAFGILPDLFAFTPAFVYIFYSWIFLGQEFGFGRPESAEAFPLSSLSAQLYNYSHSGVIWLAVLLLVFVIIRKFPWVLLGWGLHVGIDIFSHTKDFYATPFLFPFSDFTVSAVSWGHPVFMSINYGLLLILYLFVIPKLRRKDLGLK